eukprot:TRINITY_DN942_c0_g1_i5.p1 TRINITY_DN942_c0_g1~~TRINITY_DN942_c0_g1_i5.p1  ORF type:complete len:512 (+),score=150.57 TRINITY_DN942_c0_g1_i5:110-1645(+)
MMVGPLLRQSFVSVIIFPCARSASFVGLFLVVLLGPANAQDCGNSSNDFGIVYNGNTAFSVSQANGSCVCAGAFVGSGQKLADLEKNPVVAAMNSTISAQASLINTLVATIGSLNSTLSAVQAQLAAVQSQPTTTSSAGANFLNLAFNKTVVASSYYNVTNGWGKERLVDNLANTTFVTTSTTFEWAQVDLGALYSIGEIVLVNRWDCCQERIGTFFVFAASFDMSATSSSATLQATAQFATSRNYREFTANVLSVPVLTSTPVRYVRVQRSSVNYLDLTELQVYSPLGMPRSCQQVRVQYPTAVSGPYVIDADGPGPILPQAVYCDMVTDGGGWTLGYRLATNSQQQYQPGTLNPMELVSLGGITQVAKLSDAFVNAFNPAEVWSICGGRQTIYRRNVATPWASNIGTPSACNYNRGTYDFMRKDFIDRYDQLVPPYSYNGGCGGMNTGTYYGVLMGIMNGDNAYFGCYDSCAFGTSNTSTCSTAPTPYSTPYTGAWGPSGGGSGYVLFR